MRKLLFFALFLILAKAATAQEAPEASASDSTKVFDVLPEMPRFPGCEFPDSSLAFRQKCAEARLYEYLYSRLVYPDSAREQGLEGTVVASFIVREDGSIDSIHIVRDIGGGCGEEVLRVLRMMQADSIRWRPGYNDEGQPVAVHFNLPVRFKLETPLPYALVHGDTVYVEVDSLPRFKGGDEALEQFLRENLHYPLLVEDTCILGDMNVDLLINPDGSVKVLNVLDYHGLGFDYQFEAIQLATSTYGHWVPAMYEGRAVPTSYMLYIFFEPQGDDCADLKLQYEQAQQDAIEGLKLFNEDQKEEGLALLNKAVEAFPNNANFRYTRAQMYLALEEMEKACEDLSAVRQNMVLPMVEQLYPLICR